MIYRGLHTVKEKSFFCEGVFAIGVHLHDGKAILIDSGSDEQSAKVVYNALQEAHYEVAAIINTHRHPDHCGGNNFFQKKFPELKTFCTVHEKLSIEDPSIAPECFCSGAAAFNGLKNKHIAPQKASIITDTIVPYADHKIDIYGTPLTIVTLPGHTSGSIGVITSDNVLYAGDALFGEDTLRKHPVLFYTDIAQTLMSFKKLSTLSVNATILYHGGVIYDLPYIIKLHEEKIVATKNVIVQLLKQEVLPIDLLTQRVMQFYKIPDTVISFILTQTTVKAYVAYLEQQKTIELKVKNGLLQVIVL